MNWTYEITISAKWDSDHTGPIAEVDVVKYPDWMSIDTQRAIRQDYEAAMYRMRNDNATIAEQHAQIVDDNNTILTLRRALNDLEVMANTVIYCYNKRPENFAVALRELRLSAERARSAARE